MQISQEEFEKLTKFMLEYQGYAVQHINDILWNEGATLIQESIQQLLPVSGRTWRGKKKAAKQAAPFTVTDKAALAVEVGTKYAYHYLYFPDDGSTTRKHAGNQQFMLRGAEAQQERILELCVAKLVEEFR
jgi:hypothetical protein